MSRLKVYVSSSCSESLVIVKSIHIIKKKKQIALEERKKKLILTVSTYGEAVSSLFCDLFVLR